MPPTRAAPVHGVAVSAFPGGLWPLQDKAMGEPDQVLGTCLTLCSRKWNEPGPDGKINVHIATYHLVSQVVTWP